MRKKALLINIVTIRLALCLVVITLLFTGLTQGERMVMHALSHQGAPYVFNTQGPDRFDCSGLVLHVAAGEGIADLPHAAKELYHLGLPGESDIDGWIDRANDLRCRDVVVSLLAYKHRRFDRRSAADSVAAVFALGDFEL